MTMLHFRTDFVFAGKQYHAGDEIDPHTLEAEDLADLRSRWAFDDPPHLKDVATDEAVPADTEKKVKGGKKVADEAPAPDEQPESPSLVADPATPPE